MGTDALFQIARMFEATSRTTSNAVGSVGFLFDFKSYLWNFNTLLHYEMLVDCLGEVLGPKSGHEVSGVSGQTR